MGGHTCEPGSDLGRTVNGSDHLHGKAGKQAHSVRTGCVGAQEKPAKGRSSQANAESRKEPLENLGTLCGSFTCLGPPPSRPLTQVGGVSRWVPGSCSLMPARVCPVLCGAALRGRGGLSLPQRTPSPPGAGGSGLQGPAKSTVDAGKPEATWGKGHEELGRTLGGRAREQRQE